MHGGVTEIWLIFKMAAVCCIGSLFLHAGRPMNAIWQSKCCQNLTMMRIMIFELLQQSISWFWLSPFFRGWEGRSSVPGNCWNEPYQIWREHRPLIGSGNFRFTIFCYFLKIRGLAGILGRKLRPYLQFFIPCTIEGRNGRNIWVAFSSSA